MSTRWKARATSHVERACPRARETVSDSTLHVIPTDPQVAPSVPEETRALAFLRSRFAHVDCQRFDDPVFVDAGQSFDRVYCPSCGAELELDWWARQMDAAHEGAFTDLSVRVPCCGNDSSLNDLRYEMPQGFARFTLSIREPGRDLAAAELRELEQLLGLALRVVWART